MGALGLRKKYLVAHMVIYRGADGKPGYHQTDEIHDAVGYVEQIRNQEGVEHARIFRLEEVVFEYQPYFRVQISATDDSATELDIVKESESETLDVDEVDAEELETALNGDRRGLFGR